MALVTETGSFHFPNNHRPHAESRVRTIKVGVKTPQISEAVYNSYPWSRIELMRQVLNTVKRDVTGASLDEAKRLNAKIAEMVRRR